jgi:hypothetical protein
MSRRVVRASSGFLAMFLARDCRYSYEVIQGGRPPDAVVVDAWVDLDRVWFIVESAAFEPADGPPWPELEPAMRRVERPELATAEPCPN